MAEQICYSFFILYSVIFKPIGRILRIQVNAVQIKLEPIPELERQYQTKKKGLSELENELLLQELAHNGSFIKSRREIERWLRKKAKINRALTTLNKVSESSWKLLCHGTSFFVGLWVLWNKTWLWDIRQCWDGHPHHVSFNKHK